MRKSQQYSTQDKKSFFRGIRGKKKTILWHWGAEVEFKTLHRISDNKYKFQTEQDKGKKQNRSLDKGSGD